MSVLPSVGVFEFHLIEVIVLPSVRQHLSHPKEVALHSLNLVKAIRMYLRKRELACVVYESVLVLICIYTKKKDAQGTL